MLSALWNSLLYQPLFNFLIWIYNDVTAQNFGWAVIVLTAALRIVLLPLTVVSEMNKKKNADLEIEVERIIKEYRRDPVLQKQEIHTHSFVYLLVVMFLVSHLL
jgi:membrane protein insertase Oxa1/YidC/SpoIIIJ